MKKRISLILVFAMLLSLLVPLTVITVSADPTLLTNASGLSGMSATGNYKLANDITIGGKNVTWSYTTEFKGTLDGDGHTIYIAADTTINGGLFQQLRAGATIKNLNIVQVGTATWKFLQGGTGSCTSCIGGVAAIIGAGTVGGVNKWGDESYLTDTANKVTITNVTVTADIAPGESSVAGVAVGGMVGEVGLYLDMSRCVFNGSIVDTTNRTEKNTQDNNKMRSGYGGMIGLLFRKAKIYMTECINNGYISGYGHQGGMVGTASPVWSAGDAFKVVSIKRCVNYGKINCSGSGSLVSSGGIIGYIYCVVMNIDNNINYGSVTVASGSGSTAGGLFAFGRRNDTSTIQANVNYGTITANTTGNFWGSGIYGSGTLTTTLNRTSESGTAAGIASELNSSFANTYTTSTGKVALAWEGGKRILSGSLSSNQISNQADLAAMSANGSYTLVSDFTITDTWYYSSAFTGTLDGGGHTITIAEGALLRGGLFKQLATDNNGHSAVIKNLKIVQAGSAIYTPVAPDGSGAYCVGVLAASIEYPADCNNTSITAAAANTVKIQNVTVTATINSITLNNNDKGYAVGGIIGEIGMITLVENCTFNGSISDVARTKADAGKYESGYGGIVGVLIRNGGTLTVSQCINNASITGYASEGGILGHCRTWSNNATGSDSVTIEKCINKGTITGMASDNKASVGGIAGHVALKNTSLATIKNCINTGTIASALENYAGGIVGCVRRGVANQFKFIGNLQEADSVVGSQIAQEREGSGALVYENNYGRGAGIAGYYSSLSTVNKYADALYVLNRTYSNIYVFRSNKVTLKWADNQSFANAKTSYKFAQMSNISNGKRSIRLVAGIPNDLTLDSVGIQITIYYEKNGVAKNTTLEGSTTTVHQNVRAGGEIVTAASEGSTYLYTATINDVSTSNGQITLLIRTFHMKDGAKIWNDYSAVTLNLAS